MGYSRQHLAEVVQRLVDGNHYGTILELIDRTADQYPAYPGVPASWIEDNPAPPPSSVIRWNSTSKAYNWLRVKRAFGRDATRGYTSEGHLLYIMDNNAMDIWLTEGAPGIAPEVLDEFLATHPEYAE